jgi:hypothetical protein
MLKGLEYAASRIGATARVAVEASRIGLTGDYLRVRLGPGAPPPGALFDVRLGGSAKELRAGAAGRGALPVLDVAG